MTPSPVTFKVTNADAVELDCTLGDDDNITINSADVDLADMFPSASQLRSFMDEIIRIKQLLNINGLVKLEAEEEV